MEFYHLPMFGGHWSSASGDVIYLTRHVTSQNHVIERPRNFLDWISSWHVITLPSVVVIGIMVVQI